MYMFRCVCVCVCVHVCVCMPRYKCVFVCLSTYCYLLKIEPFSCMYMPFVIRVYCTHVFFFSEKKKKNISSVLHDAYYASK